MPVAARRKDLEGRCKGKTLSGKNRCPEGWSGSDNASQRIGSSGTLVLVLPELVLVRTELAFVLPELVFVLPELVLVRTELVLVLPELVLVLPELLMAYFGRIRSV